MKISFIIRLLFIYTVLICASGYCGEPQNDLSEKNEIISINSKDSGQGAASDTNDLSEDNKNGENVTIEEDTVLTDDKVNSNELQSGAFVDTEITSGQIIEQDTELSYEKEKSSVGNIQNIDEDIYSSEKKPDETLTSQKEPELPLMKEDLSQAEHVSVKSEASTDTAVSTDTTAEARIIIDDQLDEEYNSPENFLWILTLCGVNLLLLLFITTLFIKNRSLSEKVLSLGNDNKKIQSKLSDHSMVLKLSAEIAKIQSNLSKMDPSTKGYKQLVSVADRINKIFEENGYDLISLIGREYNPGINCEADFVIDESLPADKAVITGMIRLQVNYKGKMIQPAKIIVSKGVSR